MPQFNVTELANDQFLVEGTDNMGNTGQTVLTSHPWANILMVEKQAIAEGIFGKAVKKHMKDILKAVKEIEETFGPADPLEVYTVTPGTEGEKAEEYPLDYEGKVLFAIASGLTHRLRWVRNDILVLTKS